MLIAFKAFGASIDELLIAFLIVVSFYFYGLIWWNIFNKAGYRPTNSLLMYIPFINLVLLSMLAFQEWPFAKYTYMRSLRKAMWLERKGKPTEAITEYENGIKELSTYIEKLKQESVQDDEQRAIVRMI